jgi:hypothetical protein
MPLITKQTALDSASLAGAEAAHHLASTLKSGWQSVWNRAPQIIAAELNADLTKSVAIFQLNAQASSAVNALLDAVNDERFSVRVPTSMPSGWELTEAGFTYTAPPEPEIESE